MQPYPSGECSPHGAGEVDLGVAVQRAIEPVTGSIALFQSLARLG